MANILIVDDDRSVCAALRILLEYEGFRAIVAESGTTGLEAARASNVDVVVLDMHMPVVDGLATMKSMRRSGLTTPIIAISGFLFQDITAPGEDVLIKAIALGAAVALRKPFKPKELLDAIKACLPQDAATGQAPVDTAAAGRRAAARC